MTAPMVEVAVILKSGKGNKTCLVKVRDMGSRAANNYAAVAQMVRWGYDREKVEPFLTGEVEP